MEKKIVMLAAVLVALLLLGGALFFIFRNQQNQEPIGPLGEVKSEKETELALWEDPAGFSFSYPESLEIDPHEEDMENYAHLELTSNDHSGRILVWCQETDYTDIEDWAEEEVAEESQALDTELGGEPAKKLFSSEPKKLTVAAIDVDALVLVEVLLDEEDYWQEVSDQLLASFTFVPLEGEEAVAPGPWEGGGGAGGIIEEAEEIIE